ncbi:MAG: helix-turn-helix transcriptional regulator [Halieaceae bacterium]|jgi:predicted transcriptional regulator|nr:helix-turn-helix transcriptional regulator [Halieaceae bacterium]
MPTAVQNLASEALETQVAQLASQLRQRRKAMGVSVATAAEAAGMSRDTWHRMEKGSTTVTIGAWFNALSVLGDGVSP